MHLKDILVYHHKNFQNFSEAKNFNYLNKVEVVTVSNCAKFG